MKAVVLTLALVLVSGCASLSPKTEDLQKAEVCKVWKDGPLGSKTVVEVKGELAQQQITCWIMNMWGCTYTDYTFAAPGSPEIRSSLPPKERPVGHLVGRKVTVSMGGITVDPFELGQGKANYMLAGPIGGKRPHTVEYNSKCTPRQAVLGLFTMIAK